MPTIKIELPDAIDLSVFTLPKGAPGRAESKRTTQVKPGEIHPEMLATLFEYGTRRWVNDRNAGAEGDDKWNGITATVKALNDGKDYAGVTGQAPRAAAKTTDPVRVAARTIARKRLKATMDAAEYKAAYTDAAPTDQIAGLDAWLDGDDPAAEIAWRMARDQVAFLAAE